MKRVLFILLTMVSLSSLGQNCVPKIAETNLMSSFNGVIKFLSENNDKYVIVKDSVYTDLSVRLLIVLYKSCDFGNMVTTFLFENNVCTKHVDFIQSEYFKEAYEWVKSTSNTIEVETNLFYILGTDNLNYYISFKNFDYNLISIIRTVDK